MHTYLSFSQISVLNGSFEIHPFTTCTVNLFANEWSANIQYSEAINNGIVGFDLYEETCYIYWIDSLYTNPVEGDWFIGLSSSDTIGVNPIPELFTLELSSPLDSGEWYEFSFHNKTPYNSQYWSNCQQGARAIFGLSMIPGVFSDTLYISPYSDSI